ncbi:MAG: carbohydrate binding domain-containing protein [Planctomycetota bacterium]
MRDRAPASRGVGLPLFLLLLALPAFCAAAEIRTADGLRCRLDAGGRVAGVTVGDAELAPEASPTSGFAIRDVAAAAVIPVAFPVAEKDGRLRQQGVLDNVRLSFKMEARSAGDRIEFAGSVTDERKTDDRAVDVLFRLPFQAKDLTWWQDIRTPVAVSGARKPPAEKPAPADAQNVSALGDAEKASFETEEVKLENDIYPFACLTDGGRAGIALAVAADSPCNFSMSYLPAERCVEITFKFGLSQLPRNADIKGGAPFKFVLYRVDPAWGFRDAARRYYAICPDAFRTRTDRYGLWLFVGTVPEAKNPQHYTFHEGGPRGAEMDEIYNIYTCPYVIVGQREFDSSAADYDGAMAELERLDPAKTSYYGESVKALIDNCSLRDPTGRHIIKLRRKGGSIDGPAVATFPMNPDPSLWEDQGKPTAGGETIAHATRVVDSNPYVDGIYVDSLGSWGAYQNARREHFAYADLSLTHDDKGNVIIWNRFAQVEFLRALKKMLHARGKVLFGNGIRNQRMWCAFECDVHGVEANRTVHQSVFHYCWFRTIAYRKPFLLLYYYNYPSEDCPREAASEYIQSAIAYGIAPEVRPFGKFIERDMDLYNRFIPIHRLTMHAGWEPITHARASDSRVWLERFGGGSNGLFFNVYNPLAEEVRVTIQIDLKALEIPTDVAIKELVTRETWKGASVELSIPPKSLRTLQVGDAPPPPEEIKLSREEVIERVLRLQEQASGDGNLLDNSGFETVGGDGRPAGWGVAVHGNAEIEVVDTEAHAGKRSLRFRDPDEKGSADITIPFAYLQSNTTYELSAWIKQAAGSETPGRLWYQWRKGGKRIAAERFDFPKATAWTECRWELVPPEGAEELSILLGVSVPEKAEFYFDDVRLVRRKKGDGGE